MSINYKVNGKIKWDIMIWCRYVIEKCCILYTRFVLYKKLYFDSSIKVSLQLSIIKFILHRLSNNTLQIFSLRFNQMALWMHFVQFSLIIVVRFIIKSIHSLYSVVCDPFFHFALAKFTNENYLLWYLKW